MPEALIWGASGGIGSALVQLLHQKGWRTYGAARNIANIPPVCDDSHIFRAEDYDSIQTVVRLIGGESDGLELVIYAAGELAFDKLDQLSPDDWRRTLDSNLNGAYLTTIACLPLLKPQSHLIFIGAYLDHITIPKMGAYATAKAGLEALVAVLQKENRKYRFSIVHPGPVDTPFWRQVSLRLPSDAQKPAELALAILDHHLQGGSGTLNL